MRRRPAVTNDDIGSDDATLTVIKLVDNGDGDTELPGDFFMTVALPGGGTVSFPGSSGTTELPWSWRPPAPGCGFCGGL